MISARNFLTDEEKDLLVQTIRKVEAHTSSEIRIHFDDHCEQDVMDRAVAVFYQLNMEKTIFRNGVLIYFAVKDKQFAVIGDEAIHQKVDAEYWKAISNELHQNLRDGNPFQAIVKAVQHIGQTLAIYFPDIDNLNKNELSDEISF